MLVLCWVQPLSLSKCKHLFGRNTKCRQRNEKDFKILYFNSILVILQDLFLPPQTITVVSVKCDCTH